MDDHTRGEVTLDDRGLLLNDAERVVLAWATAADDDAANTLVRVDPDVTRADAIRNALESVGRLRRIRLEQFAAGPERPPMTELRDRVRLAVERQTARVLEEDQRLTGEDVFKLQGLALTYTTLGGDLEVTATVPGDQYAEQATELSQATAARRELEQSTDRLLDAIAGDDHVRDLIRESPVLDRVRERLEALAITRGRS